MSIMEVLPMRLNHSAALRHKQVYYLELERSASSRTLTTSSQRQLCGSL